MKKVSLGVLLFFCALFISCGDKNNSAKNNNAEINEQEEKKSIIGTELYVQENLRLREEESTDSRIITTMSFGTKLRVIEVGREDEVEDSKGKLVPGNWIKVEIDHTTYDRKGKLLKGGTTGWCFSGYLAKTLSHKNLIGYWKSKDLGMQFTNDGEVYWGDWEDGVVYGKGTWYADENVIYVTIISYDGDVTDHQWKIVYLEKDALGINWDGSITELVRGKSWNW